jgi:hypothetical protein
MSAEYVYCPKCGTPSTDGSRFCRKCGTNLEAVSRALTGQLGGEPSVSGTGDAAVAAAMEIEYAREYSKALYNLLGAVAVFLAMLAIFRGAFWVYFLLFWVANEVRDLAQAYLLKRQIQNPLAFRAALDAYKEQKSSKRKRRRKRHEEEQQAAALPPPPATIATPPPARPTGELVKPDAFEFDPVNPPASVTEGTTELLEKQPRYRPPEAASNRD